MLNTLLSKDKKVPRQLAGLPGKTILLSVATALSLIMISSCKKEEEAAPQTTTPTTTTNTVVATVPVTYSNTVSSIISTHCTVTCHTSGKSGWPAAHLTTYSGVKAEVDAGTFYNRVIYQKNMPPSGSSPLSADEIQKLTEWINNGAPQ